MSESMRPSQSPPPGIFRRSCAVYGVIILASLFVCAFVEKNLTTLFFFPLAGKGLWHFASVTVLPIGILLALAQLFENWFASYRLHRMQLALILGRLSFAASIGLALLAAAGEELLFRGVIQNHLGIFFTSMIVGLLHLSPQGVLTTWSLFGFLCSVLLGLIFHHTHSIVPGFFIHLAVNLSFLLRLFFSQKKTGKPLSKPNSPVSQDSQE